MLSLEHHSLLTLLCAIAVNKPVLNHLQPGLWTQTLLFVVILLWRQFICLWKEWEPDSLLQIYYGYSEQ